MEPHHLLATILPEADVSPARRAAAAAIFPERWRAFAPAPTDGYTFRPPAYRALLELDGQLWAQLALVELAPGVYGLTDWCTRADRRGRGLAAVLAELATAWADAAGATLLVDTAAPGLRRVLARRGFTPATDHQAVLVRDDTRTVPPTWLVRGELVGLTLTELF